VIFLVDLCFDTLLLLLLLLLHRTLYLHDLQGMLAFETQSFEYAPTQQLTSIFLLSLFSVISLMLISMRLLYHPEGKGQHSSQCHVR
jgi:hypothetical protein